MNMGIVAVLWFGGIRVDTGHLTQGELTAFVNYMTQIALSMVRMAELLVSFNKAAASAKRISDVLAEEPDIRSGSLTATEKEQVPVLTFDHVTFAYPDGGEPALHDISFSLNAGETLGIIGGTGSGKSTIINLIPRFYDVTEGSVQLYGEDVRKYTLDSLRDLIGVVPQKASLVSGTIADNLRWGNADADENQMIEACQIAQAWEFVSQTENGLQTPVAQGGRSLSGGQKRRCRMSPRSLCLSVPLPFSMQITSWSWTTAPAWAMALMTSCWNTVRCMRISTAPRCSKEGRGICFLSFGVFYPMQSPAGKKWWECCSLPSSERGSPCLCRCSSVRQWTAWRGRTR